MEISPLANARTSNYSIISEKYEKYAEKVLNLLENHEIRALVDNRNETMGKKIREAEMNKIPYMIIVGENEEKENKITVRQHGGEDLGMISVEEFSEIVKTEINKTLKHFKNKFNLKYISHSNT